MSRFLVFLSAFFLAPPCFSAQSQMDQLLKIGTALASTRLQQPGGLCTKAVVPNSDSTQVSRLLSTIDAAGLKDELGYSPAYYAVMVDNPKELKRLLTLGYSTSGPQGSLLNAAAYWNSVKSASLLLDHGVNQNRKNAAGGTPLLVAVSEGGPDVAVLLIHHGARIDDRTVRYARICKNKTIVDLLVHER